MHAGGIVMEGSPAELIERTRTGNLTDAFLKAVGEA
jgi:ABC-type Na+ transport system ATPase subunit NatA